LKYLNNNAANAAQINGATMKIQTIPNDQSHHTNPWNNAGPKLLAGFTEVQVNPSHNK
jgi:hypothetical protein